jgi:hypothetical protein
VAQNRPQRLDQSSNDARRIFERSSKTSDINPALDQFKDLARQLRQDAEEQARRHDRELGAADPSAIAA